MTMIETICSRKSIRSYTGENITAAELDVILKAANAAPVGMGQFDSLHLTVITNNMEAVIRAMPYENITVIVLPGQLSRKTNSLTGDDTVSSLRRYNIRVGFMAATGVSCHGATNSSAREYEIKRAAVERCEKSVLLVSKEKIGVTGLMTFAPLNAFDAVITDASPRSESTEMFREENVELVQVSV